MQEVSGLEIAGRQIKVGLVNEANAPMAPSTSGPHQGDLDDDGIIITYTILYY